MAPWWHQNHRLTAVTDGGAWVCSCGAKGRDGAQKAAETLYVKHVDRVKKQGEDQVLAIHRTPNYKLPRYPYFKIPPRDHRALGSLFN